MRRRCRSLIVIVAGGALGSWGVRTAVAEDFVVVVNEANPTRHLTRAEVSRIFLKRTPVWPNGSPVVPYDLSATSPTRAAFTLAVHKKPMEVVQAFWDQEIYSGRSLPPKVHSTEQAVLHAVRSEPGALGYVRAGADLGSGVKPLALDP
jgi:ABC-type phosphate transport system substrate-binding protein